MKHISWWQFIGAVLVVIINEILSFIIRSIEPLGYGLELTLLFTIILYLVIGIIISLSKIQKKPKFHLNYKKLIICAILLVAIVVDFFVGYTIIIFHGLVGLKVLALAFGFLLLDCFFKAKEQSSQAPKEE